MTCKLGEEIYWNWSGIVCYTKPELMLFLAVFVTGIALAVYDWRELWRNRKGALIVFMGAFSAVYHPLLGLGAIVVCWVLFR